jgi:riboflavin kinase/FMN adenylyltransferase
VQVIRGTAEVGSSLERAILTIGNFDGLHVGHQAIMKTIVERARDVGSQSVVYTFDPHPRRVIRPEGAPRMLTTLEQKLEMLEAVGIDVTVVEPFDAEFSKTSHEHFVRYHIHECIRPMEVYVGYDFHFGRDRQGSMRSLTQTGPRLGFSVTIIPEVTIGERDVNSTRIRELLSHGQVEEAEILLGRPYGIRGGVVEGDRRGREIGFPTANLAAENEVLPSAGVYAGHMRMLGAESSETSETRASLPVVTNVGLRPTFDDERGVMAEAHVIDFEGDLYGRKVEVSFEFRLRAERKFPGPDALREQIARDVEDARRWLARD